MCKQQKSLRASELLSISIPSCLDSGPLSHPMSLLGGGAPLVPVAPSGYGAVAPAGPATALLLAAQLDPLALVLALPQAGSLQDLLHQLLKGTLDAVFGLRTGLCTKRVQMGDL